MNAIRRREYEGAQRLAGGLPAYYIERGNPCIVYSLNGTWWGLVMYPRPYEEEIRRNLLRMSK